MQTTHIAKYGWFTSSPADVLRSVDIGVARVVARTAPKLGLAWAVALHAVATAGARPACASRVHGDYRYSGHLGLVLHEQAQLRERPRVQNCSLLSPGLNPRADVLEVLKRDAALGAFSFNNDLLGNVVVYPGGETALFPRKGLQSALRRARLFLLKVSPQSPVTVTDGLYLRTGMPLAVGIGGDVGHSKIDPEEVAGLNRSMSRKV